MKSNGGQWLQPTTVRFVNCGLLLQKKDFVRNRNQRRTMLSSRILSNIYKQSERNYSSGFRRLIFSQNRSIVSTSQARSSETDTTKGSSGSAGTAADSFTLLHFAEELSNVRKLKASASESKVFNAFEKQEAILRYLGGLNPSGENVEASKKQEAAKQCNCTVDDVENVLAKFTWAKSAHKVMLKLVEEGKPMPKSMGELQKLMGSTPLDLAKSK